MERLLGRRLRPSIRTTLSSTRLSQARNARRFGKLLGFAFIASSWTCWATSWESIRVSSSLPSRRRALLRSQLRSAIRSCLGGVTVSRHCIHERRGASQATSHAGAGASSGCADSPDSTRMVNHKKLEAAIRRREELERPLPGDNRVLAASEEKLNPLPVRESTEPTPGSLQAAVLGVLREGEIIVEDVARALGIKKRGRSVGVSTHSWRRRTTS